MKPRKKQTVLTLLERQVLAIMQMRVFLDSEKRLYGHERVLPALMAIREWIVPSTRQGCAAPGLSSPLARIRGVPPIVQTPYPCPKNAYGQIYADFHNRGHLSRSTRFPVKPALITRRS